MECHNHRENFQRENNSESLGPVNSCGQSRTVVLVAGSTSVKPLTLHRALNNHTCMVQVVYTEFVRLVIWYTCMYIQCLGKVLTHPYFESNPKKQDGMAIP